MFTRSNHSPVPNGDPIALTFRGTDWEGNTATFSMPFVFVEDIADAPFDDATMHAVNTVYSALPGSSPARRSGRPARRVRAAERAGQHVVPGRPAGLRRDRQRQRGGRRRLPHRRPAPELPTDVAGLREAADRRAARGRDGSRARRCEFVDDYLDHGFDGLVNKGETFLHFPQPVPLPFSTENAGGLANPSQELSAITAQRRADRREAHRHRQRPLRSGGGLQGPVVEDPRRHPAPRHPQRGRRRRATTPRRR